MTEYRLTATSPLGDIDIKTKGARLTEEAAMAIIAMTTRNGRGRAMAAAFKKHLGTAPPDATQAVTARGMKIIPSALDQVFIIGTMAPAELEENLKAGFGACASLTDQSDGWAVLRLTGERAHETLERLSMVDLSPRKFGIGQVARTVFEHINVLVMRDKPLPGEALRYLILTPRSSAQDLCHALLESPPFR